MELIENVRKTQPKMLEMDLAAKSHLPTKQSSPVRL